MSILFQKMDNGKIVIGEIIGAFGIKGEAKIYPLTNEKQMFLTFKEFQYKDKNQEGTLLVEKIRLHKNIVVCKFKDKGTIESVLPLKGLKLTVPISSLPDLDNDEYYIYELIGARVWTDDGMELGRLCDVMDTGAHDVYVVKDGENKEYLLPGIPEVILEKNMEEKKLVVHLLPGLLD